AYFWATQAGAELDLLVFVAGKRWGFEFKNADAPRVTRSLQTARDDLKLDHAFVVHPGADSYPLNEWCETLAIRDVATRLQTLMKSKRRSP
ncbi:MAG: hypothetical protein NT069_24385, partial [Planctomycetota bacterium]|nr:hypothetical protein [Planctomycetota bacterium]